MPNWKTKQKHISLSDTQKIYFFLFFIFFAAIQIYFDNYFFAVFLVLVGSFVPFLLNKAPKSVQVEFTKDGIKIADDIFAFSDLIAFNIYEHNGEHILGILTKKIKHPYAEMNIPVYIIKDVENLFKNLNIPKKEDIMPGYLLFLRNLGLY